MIYKASLFFTLCWVCQLNAQSMLTYHVFHHSKNVFKGKVVQFRYGTSNAEGSSFSVKINIEQKYKSNSSAKQVSIGTFKLDVIDLDLDTMIMDYSFQIKNQPVN